MPTRSLALLLLFPALTAGTALAEEPPRTNEGKIETIEVYRASDHKTLNPGTVVGGIAGGVIGHQIGSGRGNTAATIVGAIGGAAIGNEIDKKQTQATRYRIVIRLDSGGTMIVDDSSDANLRVGDRVRVDGNHVYRL